MGFDCVPADTHSEIRGRQSLKVVCCDPISLCINYSVDMPSRMRMSQQQEQYSDNVVQSHVAAGDLDATGEKSECP